MYRASSHTPLFAALLILLIAGCSPRKGYEGPELPDDQVSTIYVETCGATDVYYQRASTAALEFDNSGITLLPGKHDFDMAVEIGDRPYDCIPESKFDEYGYQSCLTDRDEAIQKNKKYVPTCYVSSYQSTVYHCLRRYQSSNCELTATLTPGAKYSFCAVRSGNGASASISRKNPPQLLVSKPCGNSREETRREQFDESY